jgi:hypothetical protein
MPIYAGVCEADITPPIGVEMSDHAGAARICTAIHDPLFARALVLDNGVQRVAIVTADLAGLPVTLAREVRHAIAHQVDARPEAVLLSCTGTRGGPNTSDERSDPAYASVLRRKLIGVADQAADQLEPVHLTCGEASAQIGVSSRLALPDGRVVQDRNYAGATVPTVQSICVNGADGRLIALLFSHSCQAMTMSLGNRHITADWPGAAIEQLKHRFRTEAREGGVRENALPFFLQGCSADISPVKRGTWEAVAANGRQIAEAAHAARWNAHGRQEEILDSHEVTLDLRQAGDQQAAPFAINRLRLGGVYLLGFPAEMFAQYQLDFSSQCRSPVFCVSLVNGNAGCIPPAFERDRGGFDSAAEGWTSGPAFCSSNGESTIRSTVYNLLDIDDPDTAPYSS